MNKFIFSIVFVSSVFLFASEASAHVAVRPKEVGVAAFQTFTMGVPVEKDIPTIALRLVMPEGLKHVSPNVKPGWSISMETSGEGEDAKVTEILWTGGTIPSGQRDDFFFSAQVPAEETTVQWKAYQTYADGTVVAWDQDPKAVEGQEITTNGPYSETVIVNDLQETSASTGESQQTMTNVPLVISIGAFALAAVALGIALQKKKK